MSARVRVLRRRSLRSWHICPLRISGGAVMLDNRPGLGLRRLAGWRIIVPGWYITALFRGADLD